MKTWDRDRLYEIVDHKSFATMWGEVDEKGKLVHMDGRIPKLGMIFRPGLSEHGKERPPEDACVLGFPINIKGEQYGIITFIGVNARPLTLKEMKELNFDAIQTRRSTDQKADQHP